MHLVTKLTGEGKHVRTVSEKERNEVCRFIAIVTVSHSTGRTDLDDLDSVGNKLRNKTAAAGGNAIRLLNIDTAGDGATTTLGVAEALKCDFPQ